MVKDSHFRLTWPLCALVIDAMTCGIAHITTQVIPLIGGYGTLNILVRTDNITARQW